MPGSNSLREALVAAEVTQAELAEHLEVSAHTVWRWVNGYAKVTPLRAARAAQLLEVNPEVLLDVTSAVERKVSLPGGAPTTMFGWLLQTVLSGDSGRCYYEAACLIAEVTETDLYTVATWIAGSSKIPLEAAKKLKGQAFNPAVLRFEVSADDWAEEQAVAEVAKFFAASSFDVALVKWRAARDEWRLDPWLDMNLPDLEERLDNGRARPEYLDKKAEEFHEA